jgi:hypothetical protein
MGQFRMAILVPKAAPRLAGRATLGRVGKAQVPSRMVVACHGTIIDRSAKNSRLSTESSRSPDTFSTPLFAASQVASSHVFIPAPLISNGSSEFRSFCSNAFRIHSKNSKSSALNRRPCEWATIRRSSFRRSSHFKFLLCPLSERSGISKYALRKFQFSGFSMIFFLSIRSR